MPQQRWSLPPTGQLAAAAATLAINTCRPAGCSRTSAGHYHLQPAGYSRTSAGHYHLPASWLQSHQRWSIPPAGQLAAAAATLDITTCQSAGCSHSSAGHLDLPVSWLHPQQRWPSRPAGQLAAATAITICQTAGCNHNTVSHHEPPTRWQTERTMVIMCRQPPLMVH